jgi:hypothetical protein
MFSPRSPIKYVIEYQRRFMKKIALLLSMLALALCAAPAFAQDPNQSQGVIPDVNADLAQQLEQGDITLEEACATPGYARVNCQDVSTNEVEASASSSASASAIPTVQYQYDAPDQQYQTELPPTGGFNLPLFLGVVLAIGGLILGTYLYRRHTRH